MYMHVLIMAMATATAYFTIHILGSISQTLCNGYLILYTLHLIFMAMAMAMVTSYSALSLTVDICFLNSTAMLVAQ